MIARFARTVFASFVCFIHFSFVCISIAEKHRPSAGLLEFAFRPCVFVPWSLVHRWNIDKSEAIWKTHMSHRIEWRTLYRLALVGRHIHDAKTTITASNQFFGFSQSGSFSSCLSIAFASIKYQFVHEREILGSRRRQFALNKMNEYDKLMCGRRSAIWSNKNDGTRRLSIHLKVSSLIQSWLRMRFTCQKKNESY